MSYWPLDSGDRKARKEHRCIWCGEPISSGEHYHFQVGIFDGDFQNNKFHQECAKASSEFFQEEDSFSPYEFKRGSTGPK